MRVYNSDKKESLLMKVPLCQLEDIPDEGSVESIGATYKHGEMEYVNALYVSPL